MRKPYPHTALRQLKCYHARTDPNGTPPFDIETMEPIEPPWQAIKEWIPDDEPNLDWFNRLRNPSNPDPDGLDQRHTWRAPEIQLDDGRTLVLESS